MKRLMIIITVSCACSGCSWTGTRSVDMWGLKWENFAGMDVHAGFNSIDNVHDQRGVEAQPKGVKIESKQGGR